MTLQLKPIFDTFIWYISLNLFPDECIKGMQDNNTNIPEQDKELIERVLDGNHRAFTELVRRYENMIYGFAFKICRNREKAEETFQDTFVNVYRKLHQFDGKAKFSTWLYSIVTNNCFMKNRQRKLDEASVQFKESEHTHGHVRPWTKTPLEEVMSQELKSHLDSAILRLPVEYRIVFVLRDIEGLSAQETAEILSLSVPAVKSRLHRARVFLREQLNEYMAT
jgi:RNA polymerase sigma-70 factor, ECF subfamily